MKYTTDQTGQVNNINNGLLSQSMVVGECRREKIPVSFGKLP